MSKRDVKLKATSLSLVEFARAEKRKNCRVCKAPVEVRGQLGRAASEKNITRSQQLSWFNLITRGDVTMDELNAHLSGRHDG